MISVLQYKHESLMTIVYITRDASEMWLYTIRKLLLPLVADLPNCLSFNHKGREISQLFEHETQILH